MLIKATVRLATVLLTFGVTATTFGQSDIGSSNKFAWAENAGWLNWRDAEGTLSGAQVHATFLSGFVWGEHVGWINLGDGTPGGGTSYGNTDGSDAGVNLDGAGDLSGFGWGENIGWVNFDTSSTGADRARFDFVAGRFRGYAWGENIGWINLDDGTHFVGLDFGAHPDECSQISETISEGTHPFDNTAATTGTDPISDALCPGTFLGGFNQDIWFEYVPTVTGDVEIATCGSGFDTDLGVYQGTCGDLVSVACNGDGCETSVATLFASTLELSVVAGESYIVRVGGWDVTESGAGELLIAPLAPPGTSYVRGDCNADGSTDIGDAISALSVLFSGGSTTCTDACNVNGDSGFDIADAISLLSFLFSAGPAPSAPFPDCGVLELLGCDSFAACP